MPVNPKLLEILRCPVSQQALVNLDQPRLTLLNSQIEAGDVAWVDGAPVATPLSEALITDDGHVIYAVVDQLPAMLPNRGIGTLQLDGF